MQNKKNSNWLQVIYNPRILLFIICILLLIILALSFINMQQAPNDLVLVKVNGEQITRDDLFSEMYAQVGDETLENMVRSKLLSQKAETMGVTVSENELDVSIQEVIDESFGGSEEEFHLVLGYYGYTPETFRDEMRTSILLEKIVFSFDDYSEEELRQFFDDNYNFFGQPEEIEVRHILLETEAEAEEVLQKLEQGGDFADLAREYSIDDSSSAEGGYLGFMMRGMMVKAFEESAFALSRGEVSGPVNSEFGFHIIEVLDRIEGFEVSFEDARLEVIEYFREEKMNDYIQTLYDEAEIIYMTDNMAHLFEADG